jgi:ribulose 1,5-bisphosphate synthetase/thiazole synthase
MMLEGWNMSATTLESLPIVVIGGGPVGLAAAAHLIARNLPVKLYEAGPAVGTNLRDWGHLWTAPAMQGKPAVMMLLVVCSHLSGLPLQHVGCGP